VSNPEAAAVTGTKELQTRITHNDGGKWKQLIPPKQDSQGQPYECRSAVRVFLALFIKQCG
jgi:Sortilin, neurotensin receptor 3,